MIYAEASDLASGAARHFDSPTVKKLSQETAPLSS